MKSHIAKQMLEKARSLESRLIAALAEIQYIDRIRLNALERAERAEAERDALKAEIAELRVAFNKLRQLIKEEKYPGLAQLVLSVMDEK